jgi:FtsH-binding integral membrane protein
MAVAAASAELLDTNAQLIRATGSKLFGMLISIGLTFALLFAVLFIRPGSPLKYAAFVGFAIMIGQSLKPLVEKLQDKQALTRILTLTTGVFIGMMALGFYDRQNILGFGPYLLAGLLGLIVVQVLLVIFATPAEKAKAFDWIRAIGVALFAVLTAYDVQIVKAGASGCRVAKKAGMAPDYPRESLGLFLDFVNLFSYMGGGGD